MVYYCLECKKTHADGYKVHWKYRSLALGVEDPVIESYDLQTRISFIEKKLEAIIDILETWKMYIDRKHPYREMYEKTFDEL